SSLVRIESEALQNGADDVIYGNLARDVLVGGAGDDAIDGGVQDDLIFGDNVALVRTPNTNSGRFQTLTGHLLYDRSDLNPGVGADNSGELLTDGTERPYRDADSDVPWWTYYDVETLWHDFDADSGLKWMGSSGDDYAAGGAGNDLVFGQLGDDVLQGDGSIDFVSHRVAQTDGGQVVYGELGRRVGAWRTPGGSDDPIGPLTVYPTFESSTDGEDYVEGGGGDDQIFGGLGQDDLVGGSSSLFSLDARLERPDGSDTIFGGSAGRAGRNDDSPLSHARDADAIVGDNGNIVRIVGTGGTDVGQSTKYVSFVYDNGYGEQLVVRGVETLDYTWGGPDFRPGQFGIDAGDLLIVAPTGRNSWTVDIGGNDEIHGESGDDTVYGMVGHDRIFGDAQDDDLIGGWGNDWISGGSGSDGVLGDDGRILTSRNSSDGVLVGGVRYAEPLHGVRALLAADPDTRIINGNVLDEFIYTPGKVQTAIINVAGALAKTVDLTPYNLTPGGMDQPLYDANNSDDIMFGGWDDDFLHGGSGDDAIAGGEALPESYIQRYTNSCDQDFSGVCTDGLVRLDFYRPWNPADVLHFGADTNPWHANQHMAGRLGEFLLYNEYDPRREIRFYDDGKVWASGSAPGHLYFLNESATEGRTSPSSCIQPTSQGCASYGTVKVDGDDKVFGDLGNDWLVGGTGRDDLWGGWGNDLLNADDVLTTNGSLNDVPETHGWYQDRAFGGAGLDVLIGNTGGD
ncbi:MAG: calcium-binding protein, partial [Nocardioidaceae bacterium]